MQILKFTLLFITVLFFSNVNAKTDLTLIDINKIGHENLMIIKNHEKVDWWVEMGDKMIVSLNEHADELPKFVRIISNKKHVNLTQLAFEGSGHCDHEKGDDKVHREFTEIFSSKAFKLISTEGVTDKASVIDHKKVFPFEKNAVLIYQIENREINQSLKTTVENLQLVNQVDQNRWFSQVEFLAGFDRMEDEGLIEAGEWIEEKFQLLDLETSRIDLNDRRGFNILGFKEGVSRPDEWYVVGAHLDSRNQNWNENQRSPGAEDNASGCSGVLEIANIMSQYDTDASILFICFNAEEKGLLGSRDVVNFLTDQGDIDKVKRMLNMDMISYRLGANNTAIAGVGRQSHSGLAQDLAGNGRLYSDIDWQITTNQCCTDFLSFTDAGIISATSHQADITTYFGYHQKNDLPENLDPVMAAGIIKANVATLADLVGVNIKSNGIEIVPAHSGMWFNSEQSGHGITVEVLSDDLMLVVWYVFDNEGNQIWLVGAGSYEDDTAVIEVNISEHGVFPPDFVAEDVVSETWGTLQLIFTSCNAADFSWAPVVGSSYEAGSMKYSRLTSISGLACEQQTKQ